MTRVRNDVVFAMAAAAVVASAVLWIALLRSPEAPAEVEAVVAHGAEATQGSGMATAAGAVPRVADSPVASENAYDLAALHSVGKIADLADYIPKYADAFEVAMTQRIACGEARRPVTTQLSTPELSLHVAALNAYANSCGNAGLDGKRIEIRADDEIDPNTWLGRATLLFNSLDSGEPSPAAVADYLDLMVSARLPVGAGMLAQLSVVRDTPFSDLIQIDPRQRYLLEGERAAGIGYAVGEIFACAGNRICGPEWPYAIAVCAREGNCRMSATLLDVRRDMLSAQEWRIAESIVAQLRARHRQLHRGS